MCHKLCVINYKPSLIWLAVIYRIIRMDFPNLLFKYIALIVELKKIQWVVVKRKICVEYRMSNSRMRAKFLGIIHDKPESGCLQQCSRLHSCSAYNYLKNGTCQLLSRTDGCHVPYGIEGSFFVNLADCSGDIVWQAGNPDGNFNTQCLSRHSPLYGNVTGLRIGKCWAAVAENKGLHLPCCYKNGKFRIVSEDGTALRCIGDGSRYILHVRPNCSIMWQDYTIGDPIPAKAAQVSVWKDFSPLYMVAAKFGLWKIGYYSPAAKRIFILARTPRNPSNVQILIINWLLSLCLWYFLCGRWRLMI